MYACNAYAQLGEVFAKYASHFDVVAGAFTGLTSINQVQMLIFYFETLLL
jgi:hypothetical protein